MSDRRQAWNMFQRSRGHGMGSGSVREGLLTPSLRACLRGPYADFCLQSENLGFPGGVSFKHLFHSERAMPFSHHMSQHDMRWANPRDKQIGFFSHLICTFLETKTAWVAAMSSNYKVVPFTYLKWISSHVLCSQNQHFPFNCFHFGFFRGDVFFFHATLQKASSFSRLGLSKRTHVETALDTKQLANSLWYI